MSAHWRGLQTLLNAFECSGSVFMLGAGVSYPLVPLAAQLGSEVRRRLISVGSYPATPSELDKVAKQIIGPRRWVIDPSDEASLLEEELVHEHLSSAAIRAATVALLRPVPPDKIPVQYAVFGLAKYPLAMINFNNDGLAERFCYGNRIIHPHGTSLSAEKRQSYGWESIIDDLQSYPDLPDIEVPGLLLPQKEPVEIASTPAYTVMRKFLHNASQISIIGYSFGGMDDWKTYDIVVSTIKRNRSSLVVVSPDAYELAGRLEDDIGIKNVNSVEARWKELSLSFFASTIITKFKSCRHTRYCSRCIAYLYDCILDGGAQGKAIENRAQEISGFQALRWV